MSNKCTHDWKLCQSRICTGDLHTHHCKDCEENGLMLPISFFASSSYDGPALEIQFNMCQEKDANRAKNKQDVAFTAFINLLTEAHKKWLEEEIEKLNKRLLHIGEPSGFYDYAVQAWAVRGFIEDQISRLEAELKALTKQESV